MPLRSNRFATFVARIRLPLVAIATLTILLGLVMGIAESTVRAYATRHPTWQKCLQIRKSSSRRDRISTCDLVAVPARTCPPAQHQTMDPAVPIDHGQRVVQMPAARW